MYYKSITIVTLERKILILKRKDMNTRIDNILSVWEGKSLTNKDYSKLLNLITDDIGKAHILPERLHTLYLLATNSKKIESHKIPNDVVTMNSEFILSSDRFKKQMVKIVFPESIEDKHDVSVYSAIGIACLGAKEKSYVVVKQNSTIQKLLIEKIIFQPEKEKVHYL